MAGATTEKTTAEAQSRRALARTTLMASAVAQIQQQNKSALAAIAFVRKRENAERQQQPKERTKERHT